MAAGRIKLNKDEDLVEVKYFFGIMKEENERLKMQLDNLMYRVQLSQLQEQAKQMGILGGEEKSESEITDNIKVDENEKD